ncbi:MAG TPA: hypothetical protein VFQ91_04095 [Bryobacteraceae bacterium]|nr:hypothetical protein [Bryobacteraceae bacterium]
MSKILLLFPLFALSLLLGAVPPKDGRVGEPAETATAFFEGRFAGWPGELSKAQWEQRRKFLRSQILTAAGIDTLTTRPIPRAEIFGRKDYAGFTVEKVLIETAPNYWLGANLFRPSTPPKGKLPAIVSPHGHWASGRLEQSERGNVPARAVMLARMGFVVLNYDMVGYNDTMQTPHAFGSPAEQLWNWGPMGLQLWNSIRAVDFLQSLPDVDPARIGATGASGGATQVFLLAAVDDRIRWSAPVNMISGIMQGGSPCENGPGLRVDTFNVEIAATMAPRPMLMVAATGDWTRNTPLQEFPAMKRLYGLYDGESLVESIQINAPHNYNRASRESVYDFFARRAVGLDHGPREFDIPAFTKADLLSLDGRALPAGSLDYAGVFRQFRESLPASPSRERLRAALLAEWPVKVEASVSAGAFALSRTGRGDRVEGRIAGGSRRPVLVIHPEGTAAAAQDPNVRQWIAEGRRVLLLEPFRQPPVPEKVRFFLTFQRSEAANRAQDILTVLRWAPGAELYGVGDAAVWAAVAAAMAPNPPKLLGTVENFSGTDEEWLKVFPAPGIQWAGGWRAVQALQAK